MLWRLGLLSGIPSMERLGSGADHLDVWLLRLSSRRFERTVEIILDRLWVIIFRLVWMLWKCGSPERLRVRCLPMWVLERVFSLVRTSLTHLSVRVCLLLSILVRCLEIKRILPVLWWVSKIVLRLERLRLKRVLLIRVSLRLKRAPKLDVERFVLSMWFPYVKAVRLVLSLLRWCVVRLPCSSLVMFLWVRVCLPVYVTGSRSFVVSLLDLIRLLMYL